ncbi:MAG: cysteine--tRNA ligase, partial [Lachnospiraceae bacterium]|nr:cysteine--tRNA ligase [Lachnospiraceae bacterium]
DKIIKKAVEEGVSTDEISERYIAAFAEDTKGFNVLEPTTRPRATREIGGMVEMIGELIDKGHAYARNGHVYFKTRSFRDYGKLSKKNIDDLESGARIAVNEDKDDPLDFVLWKPKKEGEPSWETPWSDGRPGWHIECSVMSRKYLGDQIDIHAGGEDLIFPHHENEIAQTESCTGKDFSHYWMHNAFINVDGSKMSKSLGNFFLVREVTAHYEPAVLRFFLLSVHYRMPINFSSEIMDSNKNALERIRNAVSRLDALAGNKGVDVSDLKADLYEADGTYKGGITLSHEGLDGAEAETAAEFDALRTKFDEVMEDDFNTADAITAVFEMVKLANTKVTEDSSAGLVRYALASIGLLAGILGLEIRGREETIDSEIEEMINKRQEARKNKDFKTADEIRAKLLEMGIVLEDTREGVKWKRTT